MFPSALLLVIPVAFSDPPSRPDPVLEARVRNELPKALATLESKLSQVKGTGKLRQYGRVDRNTPIDAELILKSIRNISFRYNHELKAMALSRLTEAERAEVQVARKPGPTDETVGCIGKDYSFHLVREKGGPYILKDLVKAPFGERDMNGLLELYLFAPAQGYTDKPSLSQMIADPSFAITSIAHLTSEGRDCLKIDYEYDGGKENTFRGGTVVVCPAESWAIQSHDCENQRRDGTRTRATTTCKIEYDRVENGIPVPKRVTRAWPATRYVFDFEKMELGPVPEKEFTLSAYGLPEIGQPAARNHAVYYWLLGGAILAISLAFGVRYYGKWSRVG